MTCPAELAIIDYGSGNLRSVEKAFEAAGAAPLVTSDAELLRRAKRLVLPGVGAFRACAEALAARGFDRLICERAEAGVPLLGICVGMQLLFDVSDEFGATRGLGLLSGRVRRIGGGVIVPHVGWNRASVRRAHELFSGLGDEPCLYFVHSYVCEPADQAAVLAETTYGGAFASAVAWRNIAGVQFHPEKSQQAGLRLLRNFAQGACD